MVIKRVSLPALLRRAEALRQQGRYAQAHRVFHRALAQADYTA